jgi:NADH:ubiquinone reductase (H+-translocating)
MTGFPAWLAWLVLHLTFLVGFRNRLSVAINWAWAYVAWHRGPRIILGGLPSRSRIEAGARSPVPPPRR